MRGQKPAVFAAMIWIFAGTAWAEPVVPYTPGAVPAEKTGGSSTGGWKDFLKQRTRFGVGFDQSYVDNVFLIRSAQKQEDFITTVESQIAYADPRGDWLYGGSYEVNAFRYLHLLPKLTGFHHEFLAYAYYTPLARYRLSFSLSHRIDDQFVQTTKITNEIRRFSTLTRAATSSFGLSGTYDLNPTNALVLKYGLAKLDEQSTEDAGIDNTTHGVGLTWEHDLTPRLTLFGGYAFSTSIFPRAPSKDTVDHGIEFGAKYNIDPATDGKLRLKVSQNEINNGTSSLQFGVLMEFRRQVNDRSSVALVLERTTSPTVTGITENVTSNSMALKWGYDLSPLIHLENTLTYAHTETDRTRADNASAKVAFMYPIRQNINANVSYLYEQRNPSDVANHVATIGVEAQI
ncbi:MAG: hypothetical protein HY594_04300 [Candidatus Omnitrophica bacterium]|nr:hypothetical protein [Candidatus Omnitrophota bacterium]